MAQRSTIKINRAPVLTRWAAIVAERLGFDHDEAQRRDLKGVRCKKLFEKQASSVGELAQLDAALDYAREGDTLVVTKLDRLACSVRHLTELVDTLEAIKVRAKRNH